MVLFWPDNLVIQTLYQNRPISVQTTLISDDHGKLNQNRPLSVQTTLISDDHGKF
jgi:hypothetical protein